MDGRRPLGGRENRAQLALGAPRTGGVALEAPAQLEGPHFGTTRVARSEARVERRPPTATELPAEEPDLALVNVGVLDAALR